MRAERPTTSQQSEHPDDATLVSPSLSETPPLPEPPSPLGSPSPLDPIAVRRERIRGLCEIGSRIGYSCFGLAIVAFFIALMTGFPVWLVTVVLASMAVGSVVLLPAIVLGYGVKAADAQDRGEKFGY